jgi:hypothetical protein
VAKDYYILSMLPTIESLGAPAPMTPREFLALFEHEDPVRELIAAIFLSDDLLQRQAALAGGELNGFTPSVLSRSQLSGETDLPETLLPVSGDDAMRFVAPEDALWETYYQWLHTLATGSRSAFLREWIGFEVGLRNALAVRRAAELDLDTGGYTLAEDLGRDEDEFTAILNDLQSADGPLDQKETLDLARWAWLDENDAWFSFGDDEILAYAVRLLLTTRWERINDALDEAS